MTDRRQRVGRRGEHLAAFYLRLRGHRVLGRRVRTPFAEVDLVCRRGRTLVLVEVKRRIDAPDDAIWLRHGQAERLRRAARHLRRANPWCTNAVLLLVTIDGLRVRSVTAV